MPPPGMHPQLGNGPDQLYPDLSHTGREFAHCCLNATLRDYARFGRLYLEGGARDGRQIVPAEWIAASVNPAAPHLQPGENPASSWTFGYGYQWWIPEDPQGDFTAIGVWGQYIYIDPAREVIIVKSSADPDFDDNDHETIAAFRAIARAVAGHRDGRRRRRSVACHPVLVRSRQGAGHRCRFAPA